MKPKVRTSLALSGSSSSKVPPFLPLRIAAASSAPVEHQFNAETLAALEGMGFPLVRAQRALLATGNTSDANGAMEWLFAHMEDPGTLGFSR